MQEARRDINVSTKLELCSLKRQLGLVEGTEKWPTHGLTQITPCPWCGLWGVFNQLELHLEAKKKIRSETPL